MFKFPKDLLIIDVESTAGHTKASIIQLSAWIFDKSGKLCATHFNQYIIPYTLEWEEGAYKVHKIERSFLAKNGMLLKDAIKSFEDWASCHGMFELKKKYWIGQWGCGFDTGILQHAYDILGRKYPFHYRSIDVSSIVRFELANRGKLGVKCGESVCAEQLGIDVNHNKLHNALYDAQLSGQMLEQLVREA
jgi:DNA polymerase III epsilon subunit-like protein